MAVMDMAFKALTAGLGVTTLYLAATFSVNVYRGLAVAAPGVFLGMQVNTHDFCKTMFIIAKQ
jgi:hypothetical protein